MHHGDLWNVEEEVDKGGHVRVVADVEGEEVEVLTHRHLGEVAHIVLCPHTILIGGSHLSRELDCFIVIIYVSC